MSVAVAITFVRKTTLVAEVAAKEAFLLEKVEPLVVAAVGTLLVNLGQDQALLLNSEVDQIAHPALLLLLNLGKGWEKHAYLRKVLGESS
jgi:hypothetical protein